MAYCKNCGQQIDNNAAICPYCGVAQSNTPVKAPAGGNSSTQNLGWGLLGCCIPLVGLILFLVWKDEKPDASKAAGIGALVSVGVSVAFYIISIIIGVFAGLL